MRRGSNPILFHTGSFSLLFLCCDHTSSLIFASLTLQDDDYLVWPEIIQAMGSRVRNSVDGRDIHLLPPQDSLSSYLRTIRRGSQLHTSFAWLGYGALIRRSRAVDFLALVKALNLSEAEMNMADNYYTILSNSIPEIWFDQGIELGGGQPFTVGTAGEIRNNKHIVCSSSFHIPQSL